MNIITSDRKSAWIKTADHCTFSKKEDFMEATIWTNGEGYDIELHARHKERFSLTEGEFKALKLLIKALDNAR